MATNENTNKPIDNQQNVSNLEPDQLSEKETDQVVGGATYNIGAVQQSWTLISLQLAARNPSEAVW